MKKQIAVLMAAATAVTTVAPAIAGAEVTDKGNVSVKSIVETVEKALTDYPKDFTGIKNWKKSNKLVLYYAGSNASILAKKTGFAKFEDNGSLINKGYTLPKIGGSNTDADQWVIVTDSAALDRLLINEVSDSVNFATKNIAIVNRNLEPNGADERVSDFKYLVVEDAQKEKSETLTALAKKIVVKYSNVPTNPFVKSVVVVDKNGEEKTIVDNKKSSVEESGIDDGVKEVKVTFVGGTKVTYRSFDSVPDLDVAKDKDNNVIDTTKGKLNEDILKTIVKFGDVEADKQIEVPVRTGDTELYSVVGYEESTYTLKDFYTKDTGYTKVAADFINSLISADEKNTTFNLNGTTYQVVNKGDIKEAAKKANIKLSNGVYTATINFDAKEYNNPEIKRKLAVVFEDKNLSAVQAVLSNISNAREVVAGSFVRLVGENRYKTAIEVSKEQFEKGKADTVVIVGGEAVYDGLTAAPFAQTKNAPILLAHPKTGLDEATMAEIGRVSKNLFSKTVYIVGGTNSVPASVEKQLVEKFGVVVRRFAGNTRVGTSNRVAEQILNDGNSNGRLFFVGYNGQADAMSVSSVAANPNDTIEKVSFTLDRAEAKLRAAETAKENAETTQRAANAAYEAKVEEVRGSATADDVKAATKEYVNAKTKLEEAKKVAQDALANNKKVLESLKVAENPAVEPVTYLVAYNVLSEIFNAGAFDESKTEKFVIGDSVVAKELENVAINDKVILVDSVKKVKAYTEAVAKLNTASAPTAANVTLDMVKACAELQEKAENANKEVEKYNNEVKKYNNEVKIAEEAEKLGTKVSGTKKVSPIMVLQKDGVDQYTRELIKRFDMTEGYVVGGLNTVSANAFKAVKTKLDGREYNLNRIFGVDRYETNLNIVKKFFAKDAKGITVGGAVFASGNDKYLVDAQTAGSFAASKNAPIVLTADKLTKEQSSYLLSRKTGLLSLDKHPSDFIFQVGGVVSADVMKTVVESLGL